jgi:toxin ParE1/3/4
LISLPLAQTADLEIAERFLDAAKATLEELSRMPLMGSSRSYSAPELKDLRQWRIRGFTDYLIFYRPLSDGVEIVRVLHGKRNLAAILLDEEIQE